MMVNWKFAWREARQRPSRALLTLLSIIIGVAAVVAVTIASGTTNRAFDQIFKTVAGNAELEVAAPIGSGFNKDIVPKIRELPSVQAVAPLLKRNTILYLGRAKQFRLVALGIDPAIDREVRDYEITKGKMVSDATGGVMLDEAFVTSAGIKLNQQIEFLTKVGKVYAKVVAFYKSRGVAPSAEGSPMLMSLLPAQHFFKSPVKVDSAQIVLKPGTDKDVAAAEIQKILPPNIKVRPPEARSSLAEETSLSTQQGMRLARAFSLLVAIFIITNTFLINVTQRRKQLGVMRAIGGTRRQIAGMVYREAMLMGLIGTVIGSVLGVIAAHFLTRAMGSLYQTTLPAIELSIWPFLVGAGCGIGISVVAAALPARKAAHLSPLEAMRDVRAEELEGSSRGLVLIGALLVVVGACIMFASVRGWVSTFNAVWASILLLIGLVLMLPIVLEPLSSLVTVLLQRFAPVEGKLARLQLLRHHSRTTLTIGVVFIAISTGIGLANSVMDTVENVRNWYRKSVVADFTVRAESPSMATGMAADLPDAVGTEIKKVAGIESIDALRFWRAEVGGERATIIARDHSAPEAPALDVTEGDLSKLREQLQQGEVALGSVLAQRTKLKIGDELTLDAERGPQKFRVAAIVNDYQQGGLVIHMEREVARAKLGVEGVDAYLIKADHSKLPEIRSELQEIASRSGLQVKSYEEIQQMIDTMMSGVVAALWAMVVIGLLVSSVGVTNTLTINVLEQTREIGLLRIVAMTRDQVRRTIFTQAMIIAIIALLPGIIAGVAVAYLINLSMLPVTGHAVAFTLHPTLLIGGLVIGMVIVSLAAWFPANRASQLDLPTALRMT